MGFWKDKRVFITGHTGFKGGWLTQILINLGAIVKGYSLKPESNESMHVLLNHKKKIESIEADIRNKTKLIEEITNFKPDIVFHLAAQPLVIESYINPLETYETNVMGTGYLLEACRTLKNLKSIVIITTDKCYENKEWSYGYRETDNLGGYDPYSSSKGCCEILVNSYRNSFFNEPNSAGLATARAGNVIGGGDWAQNRIVPDIVRSIIQNKEIVIRNPEAVRPWQHVLDPLHGYLNLAEKLFYNQKKYSGAWNFGPWYKDCKTVAELSNKMKQTWGFDRSIIMESPKFHEANFLKLDISKANQHLNWEPKFSLQETIELVCEWYKRYNSNSDMEKTTNLQIEKLLS